MDLKEQIGTVSSRHREPVTAARLGAFRRAVGAPSVSQSEGAQGQADVAPPTFLTACRAGEFELFQKLGVPLSRVLHAEQEYVYGEPIRAGDTLSYETRLGQAVEKKGGSGSMSFLTFETDVRIEREGHEPASAGQSRTTIVVRG